MARGDPTQENGLNLSRTLKSLFFPPVRVLVLMGFALWGIRQKSKRGRFSLLSHLRILDLSYIRLSDELPASVVDNNETSSSSSIIQELDLSSNLFQGTLSSSFLQYLGAAAAAGTLFSALPSSSFAVARPKGFPIIERKCLNHDQQSTKMLNLTVLQRRDPFIDEILFTASYVSFYSFNIESNQWSHKDVEGSLFAVKRNTESQFQFIVMNRRNAGTLMLASIILIRIALKKGRSMGSSTSITILRGW